MPKDALRAQPDASLCPPAGEVRAIRAAKILLLGSLAFFYSLVVFNNLFDFESNYQFVRHVLLMDSTIPGNRGMGRALHAPAVHLAFYLGIIAWEIAMAVLSWWGTANLLRARRGTAAEFAAARTVPVAALTLSLLLWLVAFLAVGGEWFLMWQSRDWNGQQAAFRNFAVAGIVLLILLQPETPMLRTKESERN
jgi:predicted small integral membrane protein